MLLFKSILLLFISALSCFSFKNLASRSACKSSSIQLKATTNDGYPRTLVYSNDIALGQAVCNDLLSIARKSISEKGKCYIAVPGGSVLKMLTGLKSNVNDIDWTKVYWFYVNHKCVPSNDETSTHFKAQKYFMKELYSEIDKNVVSIELDDNVQGHDTVAHKYENRLKELVPDTIFDYMLIGMGKDGHIGSLYPNRKEVTLTNPLVLTVDKKQPPSITLSLAVMNAARNIRVVLAGDDKADACYYGIGKTKTPTDFPAAAISSDAIWMIDSKASTQLTAHKIPYTNK